MMISPPMAPTPLHPSRWTKRQHRGLDQPRALSAEEPLIYGVDDSRDLTELYAAVLVAAGCRVKMFNDRDMALASLEAETKKPRILITDYRGEGMPAERFMQRCLNTHPPLRILMATGLAEMDVSFIRVAPHEFIQKPFVPDQLLAAVDSMIRFCD